MVDEEKQVNLARNVPKLGQAFKINSKSSWYALELVGGPK